MNLLKVLSDEEAQKIHSASVGVLDTIGLKFQSERARRLLEEAGAKVNHETTLVRFPPSLVEDSIKKASKRIIYGGRNPKYDLALEPGGKTYSRPLTGSEGYIDLETRQYQLAKMSDVKDWARLSDALENISYCASPYPHDVRADIRDILVMRVLLENTEKYVEVQPYSGKSLEYMIELALAVRGSEEELKNRPIFTALTSSLSPLQYSEYATDVITLAGRYGIPVSLTPMPVAGGNGLVTIAGTVLLAYAEALAGGVLAQVANPGAPLIYRPNPLVLDMSTGVGLQGGAENAMIAAASVQVAREGWGIPTNMFGLVSDSLITDGQSMIERVFNTLLTALAGVNIVSGAGGVEHCYTVDPVQLVIDDEIIGMTFRTIRGFAVNDDALGLDVLAQVGPGGNFLAAKHTLKYFRGEYFRPHVFNRDVRDVWKSKGEKDLNESARQRARTILKEHEPAHLSEDIIKEFDSITKRAEQG